MAIEDAYTLAAELAAAQPAWAAAGPAAATPAGAGAVLADALQRYESRRRLRVGTIHGMARLAANMASTYKARARALAPSCVCHQKLAPFFYSVRPSSPSPPGQAYLGEGLGPLSWISKLRIPHPGSASGKVVMQLAMPFVLDWVLGGNEDITQAVVLREPRDGINSPGGSTQPKLAGDMSEADFATYLADDNALLRAADADWLLVPMDPSSGAGGGGPLEGAEPVELSAAAAGAASSAVTLGREAAGSARCAPLAGCELVSRLHARVEVDPATGDYYVVDERSSNGTWLNRGRLRPGGRARLVPGDELWLGARGPEGVRLRVKLRKRVTAEERAERAAAPAYAV